MPKYQKFVFKDFPKESVVHTPANSTESDIKDQIIAGAVVQHLETIIESSNPSNTQEDSSENVEHTPEQEKEPEVDLTEIRAESYKLGYEEAKKEDEVLIEQLKSDLNFSTLLQQKLDSIAPTKNIDQELLTFSVECIKSIANKLFLALPVEFNQVLLKEMLSITHKFYKEGQITVRVHTNRLEYSQDLLKSDSRIKQESVNILVDENLGINDCVVEWNETRLEYNQEMIKSEVDRIFDQLEQQNY